MYMLLSILGGAVQLSIVVAFVVSIKVADETDRPTTDDDLR